MPSKTTKSTDEIFDDNAEASRANGVRRKGSPRTPPPGKAKVQVTHKRTLGLAMLVKYQLMVMAANTVSGLVFVSMYVDDPTYKAHAMWAYGIANAIAMVPSLIRKLE